MSSVKLKILQVHNYYQRPGGEDVVVAAERELLQAHGHEVLQYTKHNDEVEGLSRFVLLRKTLFNSETERELRDLVHRESPDLIHSHNTFPLISPSIYSAAAKTGIPVVQTLHNFRLLCPSSLLFRDGHACEDCVGHFPLPAVLHACYRGSRSASAAAALMIGAHRALGTWRNGVQRYIALNEFSKSKFVEGGLPESMISVKTNFLPRDPGAGDGQGGYALFAGRISREKGVGVLIGAWERLQLSIPLKIAGDGDLMPWLRERAASLRNVQVLGHCDRPTTLRLLQGATLLIATSECYEGGVPLSIIEAFGCGTPVMTSSLPSMKELIVEGWNGWQFAMSSAVDLAHKVKKVWPSPALRAEMRLAARHTYEQRYTRDVNYPVLLNIYRLALESLGSNQVLGDEQSSIS